MPNTVVTKLVTRRLGQRDFETGPLFDTLLPASSPAPPPLLLPCPEILVTYYYMARKRILDRKLLVHIEKSFAMRLF